MKQPKFGPIFLAFALFALVIVAFMSYVNRFVSKVNNVDGMAPIYDRRKYDGILTEQKALASKDYLCIFAASNLNNADCTYHPSNVFNGKAAGFIPYLVGRNSVTSLFHALKIAALNGSIRNQKIVLLVEPTNFLVERNLKIGGNISGLHAYEFVLNSKISSNLKREIARSLLKTVGVYRDPILTVLLKNLAQKHPNQTVDGLIKPIAHIILYGMEQKDRLIAYKLMMEYNQAPHQSAQRTNPDWNRLMADAEKEGEKACRTNPFSIDDQRYKEHIEPKLNQYQNSAKDSIYFSSRELRNFHLLLSLCKELNIKPLIIIEPLNGFWSDYIGLPKETRNQCYFQIKQAIRKAGLTDVDFSGHEYDKYFLHDTQHFGWKGWVYVDREMARFYHQ